MKAEALLGTVLGNCTVQQLIGQGGMGAVYLAQQERPRRQVAIKVLMSPTPLKPHQISAFLERFRRETDVAASLEHPNIMPVYEYGEHNGLPYLVMPYISGGTLRDVMEREGKMSFTSAANYIEQMAGALDFAHARGMIHRDIKPANMLLTPDSRLLLTDFGLVKILSDQASEQVKLTGVGAPVGTADYMSPEQAIGGVVDGRSDQYALGVVLFQMVTGTTPFQGEMPMQIVSQQLQAQPPAPRSLRPDLPEAAERVILRALAKRPEERFSSVQEFATAFRAALTEQPRTSSLGISAKRGGLLSGANATTIKKGGLFDAKWQAGAGAARATTTLNQLSPATTQQFDTTASFDTNARPAGAGLLSKAGLVARTGQTSMLSNPAGGAAQPTMSTGTFAADQTEGDTHKRPAVNNFQTNTNTQFPAGQSTLASFQASPAAPQAPFGQTGFSSFQNGAPGQSAPFGQNTSTNFQPDATGQQTFGGFPTNSGFPTNGGGQPAGLQTSFFAPSAGTFPAGNMQQMSPATQQQNTTSALALLNAEPQGNNTVRLTEAVKVVQVPVGGGQYVTGYLPMQKATVELAAQSSKRPSTRQKIMLVAALFILLIGGISGVLALTHAHNNTPTPTANKPDLAATAAVQASATAQPKTLFQDPLSQNIHNFPAPNAQQFFKDGAYHLYNPGPANHNAIQLVQQKFPETSLTYTISMEEIKGNDNSATNDIGIVLDLNQKNSGSLVITTFYAFEILNQNGHNAYRFFKYNNDTKQATNWTSIGTLNTPGKELHPGQGPKALNTVKVIDDAGSFTFYVNGQKIGTAHDTSLQPNYLGMLVNNQGTEVAYTNMLVTNP